MTTVFANIFESLDCVYVVGEYKRSISLLTFYISGLKMHF